MKIVGLRIWSACSTQPFTEVCGAVYVSATTFVNYTLTWNTGVFTLAFLPLWWFPLARSFLTLDILTENETPLLSYSYLLLR